MSKLLSQFIPLFSCHLQVHSLWFPVVFDPLLEERVNGFWKLDLSRYDQIPVTKGKEASFHLSVEAVLIWVCLQNLGSSGCFTFKGWWRKWLLRWVLFKWDFFNVNINRRVIHTAAGLGMCSKLTIKLHWCSHMSGGRQSTQPPEGRGVTGDTWPHALSQMDTAGRAARREVVQRPLFWKFHLYIFLKIFWFVSVFLCCCSASRVWLFSP